MARRVAPNRMLSGIAVKAKLLHVMAEHASSVRTTLPVACVVACLAAGHEHRIRVPGTAQA